MYVLADFRMHEVAFVVKLKMVYNYNFMENATCKFMPRTLISFVVCNILVGGYNVYKCIK